MSTVNIENPVQAPALPAKGIQVTEKALARIRAAMAKENISPTEGGLRLGVQGGGCSGLSYNIRFDTPAARARPRLSCIDDVRVFVDPKSFIYLHGMILDYEETPDASGLRLPEPECEEILRLRKFFFVGTAQPNSTPVAAELRTEVPWLRNSAELVALSGEG